MSDIPGQWKQERARHFVRIGLWTAALASLAVVMFYSARWLTIGHIARAEGQVPSFTMRQEMYGEQPARVLALTSVFARRSDGATSTRNQSFDQLGHDTGDGRVIDFSDGSEAWVFDDVASVVKSPAPPALLMARARGAARNAASNCLYPGETLVGQEQIQGFLADVVKLKPVGNAEMTVWLAPELGCAALETRSSDRQPDGTVKPAGETDLVSVTMGEPDRSLFEVPSNYASVMPSEAMRKSIEHSGLPWTDMAEAEAQRSDAAYTRHLQGQWGPIPKTKSPAQPQSQ
ncbi:MAG: hypothetical protein ACRD4S_05155 [Candidatus Acidiferrales bacterium]